jgi:hypothetical protein
MEVEIMTDRGKPRLYSEVDEIITEDEGLRITKQDGESFVILGSIFRAVSEESQQFDWYLTQRS